VFALSKVVKICRHKKRSLIYWGARIRPFVASVARLSVQSAFAASSFRCPILGAQFSLCAPHWKCDVSVRWGYFATGEHAAICGAAALP
jgi:hypothetical protein